MIPAENLRYLLDNREVQIEWQYATEPGGQAGPTGRFADLAVGPFETWPNLGVSPKGDWKCPWIFP